MSTTTQPTDFSDLYTGLLNRVRADTSQSATVIQAKRYINIGLHDMHIGFGEKFPWSERNTDLITQAEYTTGTVTITQGSTTLTGSSTLWNTANNFSVTNARAGGKFVINGGVEVYEVAAAGVSSDTSITLTSAFVQADVSGASYVYFEDEYALESDFLRPLDLQNFDTNGDIPLIGRNEFRFRYPRNKTTGKPRVATIVDRPFVGDTVPVRKVRFHQPPSAAVMIPYAYITSNLAVSSAGVSQTQLSADADEPIVPLIYRHVIILHALYHWYRDKRDDGRSQEAKAEYTDLMLRISGDAEIGRSRPQIKPRVSPYRRQAAKPYRGRGGRRYVVGDAFDELRE